MNRLSLVLTILSLAAAGCASGGNRDAGSGGGVDAGGGGFDAGTGGGFDAGEMGFDAGEMGFDAGGGGVDSAVPDVDSGTVGLIDAGSDAGTVGLIDAGTDAGFDAGFDASLPDAGGSTGGTISLTPGFSMSVTGDTTGGPTWNRPVAASACPATTLSAAGTMVPYETRVVTNTSGSALTVTLETMTGYDSYLIVYAGTTIPADTLMCLEADDDSGTSPDALLMFTLAPGASAVIVVSGFDNADLGPYTLQITAS
ncbi:MAG: hypothetical protein H6719_28430 [Sandaracinaceae bacterium]|nr:hypothetical protein [Sandaracinaceae bacterium]